MTLVISMLNNVLPLHTKTQTCQVKYLNTCAMLDVIM